MVKINYQPNRQNLTIGQKVILNTNDEWDGKDVTVTAIKPYGIEIAEDGKKYDEKMLFEFKEINNWESSTSQSQPQPTWRNDPPTQKQIDRLKSLGHKEQPKTKGEASDLIDRLTPSCHYCGQPATSFGFFDEAVCRQCGG